MAVQGVLFDLGSTLIYRTGLELEREKCAALAAFAAAELGCRDPQGLAALLLQIRLDAWQRSEQEQVEYPASLSIQQALAAQGLPTDDATVDRAEAAFFDPEVRASRLYPAAREVLEALRGMGLRLALVSNATSHRLVLDITRKHGIAHYFDPLLTSAAFGRTKPHPSIFRHVLETWALPPEGAVMVGDTLGADVAGAHAVGLRSILVEIEPNPDNARFQDRVRPSARARTLTDVLDLVRLWNGDA